MTTELRFVYQIIYTWILCVSTSSVVFIKSMELSAVFASEVSHSGDKHCLQTYNLYHHGNIDPDPNNPLPRPKAGDPTAG